MTQIEGKYEHILQTLGLNNIEDVEAHIRNKVIPEDIHQQSIQNTIREKLEQIGLM